MATPGVMVLVYPDPTSKAVSMVSAMIEGGDNWPTIDRKYQDVVATYKEKYGEPTEHVDEFTADVFNSDSWGLIRLHDGQWQLQVSLGNRGRSHSNFASIFTVQLLCRLRIRGRANH